MAAIAPFPHHYTVSISNGRLTAEPRPSVPVGVPPQFGGSPDVWSPEELLVAAALLCLQTTFEAFARRESLEIRSWRGSATGTLEKTAAGPAFTSIALDVDLKVPAEERERAERILTTAERHCIISRALVVPVKTTFNVTAG